MGSAQSARRIQPGGSRRPRRARGSPPAPRPPAGRGRREETAARAAPAPVGRISAGAVRRDRLRVGREGPARAGGPPPSPAAGVTAPGPQPSPHPGAEGEDRRRALPPPAPRPSPSRGRAARGPPRGGRAPPPPARLSTGADCPQCAPTASRRRAGRRHDGRPGSAATSAAHPTRLETRTKESNTRASRRLEPKAPRRNEGEGRRAPAEVGSRFRRRAEGAPPARLARPVGEVERERAC